MTTTTARRSHAPAARSPEQHSLPRSIALHLAPGAALTAFVLAAYAALDVEPLLGLLLGILLVLAPLELGYLAWHGHRTTGSWSILAAVDYREPVPLRRLVLTALGLAAWMIVLTGISLALIDELLTDTVLRWLPAGLLEMATVAVDDETPSAGALVAFVLLFFLANGVVGPVTEELYFRGHLLPRLDRYGGGAPVLNTALFTIYHFHNPWRYPAIFLGYLPIAWASWRKRSVWIGLAAHMIVNNVFVLIMLAVYLSGR